MEILLVLIALFVNLLAVPLMLVGLVWLFFIARRLYREKKSLDAFKGNEIARAMAKDRIKAGFIRPLGIVLFPVLMAALSFLLAAAEIPGEVASFIVLLVSLAVSGSCLRWSVSITKRYNANFKEHFVKVELARVFDNLNYEPHGKFDPKGLEDLRFFSPYDALTGNDLIVAEYGGLHFAQCDMGVQERYTVTLEDDKGNTRTEERWRDVFRGRAMRFDFADAFRGKVQVVSKDFDGAAVKRSRGEWQTVETELAEFGKYFDVYARDPLHAMAALTPQMLEGIFYLKKALDVPTALYFIGNSMFVFMALSREAFDVSGKRTLLEEVRLLERDIALMTGFMDVMYFKRPAEAAINRAETAASVAAAAGPSKAEKIVRHTGRGLNTVWSFLPKAIIAAYLISAVYGIFTLPSEVAAGFSYSDGEWIASPDALQVPAIGFLIVAGVFVVISAFQRAILFSLLCLAISLALMAVNV